MQKYSGVVIDAKGAPMSGVTVTVKLAGTGTNATIYSDNGVTGKSNPFVNDANGSFEFYAANGRYDIVFSKTGVTFVASDTTDIALFDGVARGVFFVCGSSDKDQTLPASTTNYMGPSGDDGTEANASFAVPFTGILRSLRVKAGGSPGQTPGYTYTVMKNGVATALAAVISGANTSASDLSNTVSVTAGDFVSVRVVTAASTNAVGGHAATFELI